MLLTVSTYLYKGPHSVSTYLYKGILPPGWRVDLDEIPPPSQSWE
jgi:hypothetical protein